MPETWQDEYEHLKPKVDALLEELKRVHGVAEGVNLIPEVLVLVADVRVTLKPLTEDEQIDVASHLLNDYIDIPGVPNFLEDDVFRFGLRIAVKSIKAALKKEVSLAP